MHLVNGKKITIFTQILKKATKCVIPENEEAAEMKEAIGPANTNPIDQESTINYILFPIRRKKNLNLLSRKKILSSSKRPMERSRRSYLSCLSWRETQVEGCCPG